MCGAELTSLPEGVQRVAAALQARGHPHAPVMLDDAARTAQQAADALGVALGQIAKSIVFRRKSDDAAVLVITAGDQRVDEKKVEALICPDGKRLGRADAAFVKERTGFSIGGVSPLAHAAPVVTLLPEVLPVRVALLLVSSRRDGVAAPPMASDQPKSTPAAPAKPTPVMLTWPPTMVTVRPPSANTPDAPWLTSPLPVSVTEPAPALMLVVLAK